MHYLKSELDQLVSSDLSIFRFLADSALDGMWFLDLENPSEEWFSDDFWTTLGYDPSEMPAKSDAWKDIIHPEDAKKANELLTAHLADPSKRYLQVIRYTHKKGHTVYIRCSGQAILENGRPKRMLGVHVDISAERRRIEQLVSTINFFKGLVVIADNSGKCLKWNDYWKDNLSWLSISLDTTPLPQIIEEFSPELKTTLEELSDGDVSEPRLFTLSAPNNSTEVHFECRFMNDGDYLYFVANDVTDFKLQEKHLEDSIELQELLVNLTNLFIDVDFSERESIISLGLEWIAKHVHADRAYIFDYNKNSVTFSNTFEYCEKGISPQIEELQDLPISLFPDWTEKHFKNEVMYIREVAEMPQSTTKEVLESQDIQSLLAIPMFKNQEYIGFIGFDWVNQVRQYETEHEKVLRVFASIIVNLQFNLERESLIELEQELNASLLASVPDPIIIRDFDDQIVITNNEFYRLTGYESKDLQGVLPPYPYWSRDEEKRKKIAASFSKSLRGQSDPLEAEIITREGIPIPVRIISQVVKDRYGNPARIITSFSDLSEVKNIREKFDFEFDLRSSIVEQSPIALIGLNYKGQFVFFNEAFEKKVLDTPNLPHSEFQNYIKDLLPNEVESRLKEYFNRHSDHIEFHSMKVHESDQKEVHTYWQLKRINDARCEKTVSHLAYGIDVSEVFKQKAQLEQANFWLQKSQRIARLAHFRYSPTTEELIVSNEMLSWFNQLQKTPSTVDELISCIHPNDKNSLVRALHLVKDSQSPQELRIRLNPALSIVDPCWIEVSISPERAIFQGQAPWIYGTVQDITSTQAIITQLQHQKRRLAEVAWDQSHLVRAPIARILALIEELRTPELQEVDRDLFTNQLEASALDMDRIVRSLIKKTELLDVAESDLVHKFQSNTYHKEALTVSIVDDDPVIRTLQKRAVQKGGLSDNPMIFSDGEAFMEFFTSTDENSFHLVLLDINMPVMDGWDVLEALINFNWKDRVRVVMVTSSTDTADLDRAFQHEIVLDYIEKPLNKSKVERLTESPVLITISNAFVDLS